MPAPLAQGGAGADPVPRAARTTLLISQPGERGDRGITPLTFLYFADVPFHRFIGSLCPAL